MDFRQQQEQQEQKAAAEAAQKAARKARADHLVRLPEEQVTNEKLAATRQYVDGAKPLREPNPLESFQLASNVLSEVSPQYSAARVALIHNLTVQPLWPNNTEPVPNLKPTKSPSQLFNYWSDQAGGDSRRNVGVVLGQESNLILLELEGEEGREWLRRLQKAEIHRVKDKDTGEEWQVGDWREFNAGRVYRVKINPPAAISRIGWGKKFAQSLEHEYQAGKKQRRIGPIVYALAWPLRPKREDDSPYLPAFVTDKSWKFKSRQVSPGVTLRADGVVAWSGSTFATGERIDTTFQPWHHPCPLWLAKELTTPVQKAVRKVSTNG